MKLCVANKSQLRQRQTNFVVTDLKQELIDYKACVHKSLD